MGHVLYRNIRNQLYQQIQNVYKKMGPSIVPLLTLHIITGVYFVNLVWLIWSITDFLDFDKLSPHGQIFLLSETLGETCVT